MTARSLAGVWRRLWEEDPLGDANGADRATLVLWTQSPGPSGLYVDLRLPPGAPGRSVEDARNAGFDVAPSALRAVGTPMAPSDEGTAALLLRQKSFAGRLEVALGDATTSGDALRKDPALAKLVADAEASGAVPGLCTCTWRRDVDYQPPTGDVDRGVCCASGPPEPDGSVDLRETGHDASYAEGWRRIPGTSDGPSFAMRLIDEGGGVARTGIWVRTGDRFAYAAGRPNDREAAKSLGCHERSAEVEECAGKSLEEAAKALGVDDVVDRMRIAGSYVAAYGAVASADGEWVVTQSTDPRLVGCSLVGLENRGDCCSTLSLEGGKTKVDVGDVVLQSLAGDAPLVRRWEVVEIEGASDLPGLQ
ncbi:hypothetical protein ACHAWF_012851 [Thalassiosira exigua]